MDRLSYTVHQIDRQCSVVPVGSWKKTPLNELLRNEAWNGNSCDQVDQLSAYMYFRPVMQQEKQSVADRRQDIFDGNFLDNVAKGTPAGCWTTTRDLTQRFGVLRNRVWPGFFVYSRANTQVFGNFYFGNGVKNCDLAFMI